MQMDFVALFLSQKVVYGFPKAKKQFDEQPLSYV
jgi:hypothetical protein